MEAIHGNARSAAHTFALLLPSALPRLVFCLAAASKFASRFPIASFVVQLETPRSRWSLYEALSCKRNALGPTRELLQPKRAPHISQWSWRSYWQIFISLCAAFDVTRALVVRCLHRWVICFHKDPHFTSLSCLAAHMLLQMWLV